MPTSRATLSWAVVAALAASLPGCSRYYWSRPRSTLEPFDQDSRECALRTSANPTDASLGIVKDKAYRACPEARGRVRTSYRGFE